MFLSSRYSSSLSSSQRPMMIPAPAMSWTASSANGGISVRDSAYRAAVITKATPNDGKMSLSCAHEPYPIIFPE